MLVGATDPGVRVASKRKGSMAPYLALLIALVIFVPALREAAADLLSPLLDKLKDLNPLGS
ncbi:hypothetical protein [Umezawaea sp. Da 62-37]|uniref:hypothetical protein n=1 Tax=Umezawaea sp. Da 62-37 TaxID=3075927 RepID=UPI0028F6DBC4|nr:hypothetical protein [Umezawaea sp. Da 62-37]WNV85726.1 hypothetical protein RM788_47705 [Umezawaea sp. Da 62-37]